MYGRYYGKKTQAGCLGEKTQVGCFEKNAGWKIRGKGTGGYGGSRKQPRGLDRRERTGLGSLRLLSPMHGRYYGEKTQAGCLGEKTRAGCLENAGWKIRGKGTDGYGGSRKQARGLDRRERTGGAETGARARQEGEDGARGNRREG